MGASEFELGSSEECQLVLVVKRELMTRPIEGRGHAFCFYLVGQTVFRKVGTNWKHDSREIRTAKTHVLHVEPYLFVG